MDALSAIMLAILSGMLCLAIPRVYADWLFFKGEVREGETECLPRLLAVENRWVQRHFWHAVVGVGMVMLIEATSLGERSPHLAQVTAVYAAVSLTLSFVESLFAQKVAAVLVGTGGSGEDEPSES
jgi:hypothetical protein